MITFTGRLPQQFAQHIAKQILFTCKTDIHKIRRYMVWGSYSFHSVILAANHVTTEHF